MNRSVFTVSMVLMYFLQLSQVYTRYSFSSSLKKYSNDLLSCRSQNGHTPRISGHVCQQKLQISERLPSFSSMDLPSMHSSGFRSGDSAGKVFICISLHGLALLQCHFAPSSERGGISLLNDTFQNESTTPW